jgi:hypothetical protein
MDRFYLLSGSGSRLHLSKGSPSHLLLFEHLINLTKSLWTLRMTWVHHMPQISPILDNPCLLHSSSFALN